MKTIQQSVGYGITFLFLLCLSLLHTHSVNAQAGNTLPGTTPGTLPGSSTVYLPFVATTVNINLAKYTAIPVATGPLDRPAANHGDINLTLRSYVSTTSALTLIDVDGDADPDAPQLAGIFTPTHVPTFTAVYQVNEWDWSCGQNGCRGNPIQQPPVTLLEMQTTVGKSIAIPARKQQIYIGGFKAMVLYAEERRITLVYTRDDTAAIGYVVHLEDFNVDPSLLALYRKENDAGRKKLPALRNGEVIGVASGTSIKVAVRDTGSFMDPRARKDWWIGF